MEENGPYCSCFECFECKKIKKAAKRSSPRQPEEETRISKSSEKDEEPPRSCRPGLEVIIAVLEEELDMEWNLREQQAVDPESQGDPSMNQGGIKNEEGDDQLNSSEMTNQTNTSDGKPRPQMGEETSGRSNSDGKLTSICISNDADSKPGGEAEKPKRKKRQKVEAPRMEVGGALREDFQARVRGMNGIHPLLILQKKLFTTDIAKVENRLSIPQNQIKREVEREFLTEEERVRVVEGMRVTIIEPSLQTSEIVFKKWKMKKTCYIYVFTGHWNSLVKRNSLRSGDTVQVWSFRVRSELHFALVKVN